CRTDAGHDDARVAQLLLHHLHGVERGSNDSDGSAMLVVVEYRNVELLLQALLDFPATGRGDILEVDTTISLGSHLRDEDDFLDLLRVEREYDSIHIAPRLEQRSLAFHHRSGGDWADVAEPKDARSVGDDQDRIAHARQVVRIIGVVDEMHADARDAWRVLTRQILGIFDGTLWHHFDFAAEMREKRRIGILGDGDALDGIQCRDQLRAIRSRPEENRQVAFCFAHRTGILSRAFRHHFYKTRTTYRADRRIHLRNCRHQLIEETLAIVQ